MTIIELCEKDQVETARRRVDDDGVVQCLLLRFHLSLGRSTNGYATSQLGQSFLQLFAIVIAGGLFDFASDLLNARVNLSTLAAAADKRRIFFVRHDARGMPQLLQRYAFKF